MDFANYLAKYDFLPIGQVGLWEMFLVVFIKTTHAKNLKNLSQSTVAAGMGGIMGNKGGC
jgi:hypothetical protein